VQRDNPPDSIPPYQRILVVCAHPDDESFGLGGIIGSLTGHGRDVELLTFTEGGTSSLGPQAGERNPSELHAAGEVLGLNAIRTHGLGTESLSHHPLQALAGRVTDHVTDMGAEAILTFDATGVTDHPDHKAASRAAAVAGGDLGVPVLTWVLPRRVASALTREFGMPFHGRSEFDIDFVMIADREAQHSAAAKHTTQAASLPLVNRRIDLLGAVEWIRRAARDRSPLGWAQGA